MDDANVPSLLAMPYLGDVDINDPIYQNTRRFVWSKDNPYFFKVFEFPKELDHTENASTVGFGAV